MSIIFVAPFFDDPSSEGTLLLRHLGASKKQWFLVNLLQEIDSDLILLNSAPKMGEKNQIRQHRLILENGTEIPVVTPSTYNSTYYGRLMNLRDVGMIADYIIQNFSTPNCVWCYNGHAFESMFASHCKRTYSSLIILEFEDWHFARVRHFNPRPFIDWLMWRININCIDYGFTVNSFLLKKLSVHRIPSKLLPGTLNDQICVLNQHEPFKDRKIIRVGYFGGLSKEKGADILLSLARMIKLANLPIKLIVTGHGVLKDQFDSFSSENPNAIEYFGSVDEVTLYRIMSDVDIILNPHEVNSGIFPFKILEAVASGKLLLSTPLEFSEDNELPWLREAIVFVKPDVNCFLNEILMGSTHYERRKHEINVARQTALSLFSRAKLKEDISALLNQAMNQ